MPQLDPQKIELDGDLIKITSYAGEQFWYRTLEDGSMQLGTPYMVFFEGKTKVRMFIPTIMGVPMQIPVILGIESI